MPNAGEKIGSVDVVNSIATDTGFETLVVGRPDDIAASNLIIFELPQAHCNKPVCANTKHPPNLIKSKCVKNKSS